ncbi:heparinase II/III family protein [Shewanella gaetbuli]
MQQVIRLIKVFNTIKHLKFKQFYYRLYYKLFKPKIKLFSTPNCLGWKWGGENILPKSIIDECNVSFLNKTVNIEEPNCWNDTQQDKLWLYNLHYFDDLNAIGFDDRQTLHLSLINRWIEENPPCSGNGWEPYPLSLRLVNWVKWFSRFDSVESKYLRSIVGQSEALTQQLEYHILGNHLFANAKALTFVGCYLEGNVGNKYLNIGLKILDSEISEQFLSDGSHFELSPMYHEILLWDLLELIELAVISQNQAVLSRKALWEAYAKRALVWLESMLHNDGEISFFNDAAIGIAPKPQQIFDYAKKLEILWDLPRKNLITNNVSGYSRIDYPLYRLFFDHANVGPDYLPGHAHADTLSFELSVGGQRVFVNSGTSLYGVSEERLRQRKTAAHNTVTVNDHDSSEVWSGFRVARRAYATLVSASSTPDTIKIIAKHDGYKRLNASTIHQRSITAKHGLIIIYDELFGNGKGKYHLHLHPDIQLTKIDVYTLGLKLPSGDIVEFNSSAPLTTEQCSWHPYFGVSLNSQKIVIDFNSEKLLTKIKVSKVSD